HNSQNCSSFGRCLIASFAGVGGLMHSAPMAGELRCQCLQTETAVIHPKRIAYVELIPEGPHCGVPEVIATTTHGKKVCLDPTARWVKIVINKILNRYTAPRTEPRRHLLYI
uniref:C-X-C motif chemokine n=1 Tax=Chrysemys picta bellii TaxID=8478 RepID=A0A8C3HTF8_CHRPI